LSQQQDVDWDKVAKAAAKIEVVLSANKCNGTNGVLSCLTAAAFHAASKGNTSEGAVIALALEPVIKIFLRGLANEGLPVRFVKIVEH
jgi:hypothetical protein